MSHSVPGRAPTRSAAGAPSALDVLFVDLPFDSYELGQRFKSAWSHRRFLCPHELHLGFRYMVSTLRAEGHTADILFPQEEGPLRRPRISSARSPRSDRSFSG
jgi:hypothetical protein